MPVLYILNYFINTIHMGLKLLKLWIFSLLNTVHDMYIWVWAHAILVKYTCVISSLLCTIQECALTGYEKGQTSYLNSNQVKFYIYRNVVLHRLYICKHCKECPKYRSLQFYRVELKLWSKTVYLYLGYNKHMYIHRHNHFE